MKTNYTSYVNTGLGQGGDGFWCKRKSIPLSQRRKVSYTRGREAAGNMLGIDDWSNS